MSKEEWRPVVGFPKYEVSSLGRVRSRGRWGEIVYMKLYDSHGYLRARFSVRGAKTFRQVHRLVLEAFVGNASEGFQCDHVNGNPADNRLENLRWVTPLENALNPVTQARRRNPSRPIYCVETGRVFPTMNIAARYAGVSRQRVYQVVHSRRYCLTAGGFHFKYYNQPKEIMK